MSSSKKYYKDIDFVRVFSCIAILLYHLNILKGGYLAVCTFFVLSGYLSCVSAFRKEKFSLKTYYLNRILKIYFPLLIIVFVTLSVMSLLPNIKWLNLKQETFSVLFGYNNFWQLSANLDYFARHVNSPFIHLWYISILLQFDLIFPFIFIGLKKIGSRFKKQVPCIILGVLSIMFTIYFFKISLSDNIMVTYYNTFTRIFSLLFGVLLGFINLYFGSLIPNKLKTKKRIYKGKKSDIVFKIKKQINKNKIKTIFYSYITILFLLFIFIDAKSILFPYSMILVTLISCRLIDYGMYKADTKLSIFDKMVKSVSKVSYEIYLLQYPIIFLFQYVDINMYLKIFLIIIITFILSYILNFSINLKDKKLIKIKYVIFSILCCITLYGIFYFITAQDYSKEMKQLEQQLELNHQMIEQKQEEYKLQMEQEQQNYEELLNDIENVEKNLEEYITNLKVVGVGDSVMLGAVEDLYKEFPNGYFDAQISRTAWVAHGILNNLKKNNMLGETIILNLGANGDCSEDCKRKVIELCENRNIFWVNVTNDKDVNVNNELLKLSKKYNNVHIIDWETISKGHDEYFFADGIHLTKIGREAYTKAIYNSIYNVYLENYQNKKNELKKEHEDKQKNKISFYGNDILLNIYSEIQNTFTSAQFIIDKEFNNESIKAKIQNDRELDLLTNKIVLFFDDLIKLSIDDYKKIVDLCEGKQVYILATTEISYNSLSKLKNITVINFYEEIKNHSEYLMIDGIHLTNDGNKALSKILKEIIEK